MMRLSDILTPERIRVERVNGSIRDKSDAIEALASLFAPSLGGDAPTIHKVLSDREELQSTGIGDGVAIPHGFLDGVERQTSAMICCPAGIDFQSIDGRPVTLIVGVLGPRKSTGEHLRVLARVSRLLRDGSFRARLLAAVDPAALYQTIVSEEEERS